MNAKLQEKVWGKILPLMKDWKELDKNKSNFIELVNKTCKEVLTEEEKAYIKANLPYRRQSSLGVYNWLWDEVPNAFGLDAKDYSVRNFSNRSEIIKACNCCGFRMPWNIDFAGDAPFLAELNSLASVNEYLKVKFPDKYDLIKESLKVYITSFKKFLNKFNKYQEEMDKADSLDKLSNEIKKLYEHQ